MMCNAFAIIDENLSAFQLQTYNTRPAKDYTRHYC